MGTESRDSRAVAWEHGVLTVESLGGMLGVFGRGLASAFDLGRFVSRTARYVA